MSNEEDAGGEGGDGARSVPRRSAGSSTLDPMIGQVVLGRYEVERRIGAGGMGAVYVGRQRTVGRNVALKILRSDLTTNEHVRERFRREAEIIGKLRHPNTIQLIDYGETDDGMAVMVMELLVGRPLNERLREAGPMPLGEALDVGIQVASSLSEAHLLGLVHRDLKPANIFLVEVAGQSHAKVLDFGIARILDEEATRLTSTGQVFGTPRYMSPEQALSTGEVDARSDIYSLGLIIYECVVGQPPFVAQTSIQYLSAHSTQSPPKLRETLPDAPEALEALVDACLAKDAEERPPTAAAVGQVLESIKRALTVGEASAPIVIPRGPAPGTGSGSTKTALSARTVPAATRTGLPAGDKTAPLDRSTGRSGAAAPEAATKKLPTLVYLAVGAAMLAATALGYLWVERSREVVSLAIDAGPTAGLAGAPDARAVDPSGLGDAGLGTAALGPIADAAVSAVRPDEGALDGGAPRAEGAPPDAGQLRVVPPNKNPRGAGAGREPGVVTGPARLVLDTGDEGDKGLLKAAQVCQASVLKGPARLTVSGCPAGCAVLVDEACAGRTPVTDAPVDIGFRDVAVVCGGKLRARQSPKLTAGETAVVGCR